MSLPLNRLFAIYAVVMAVIAGLSGCAALRQSRDDVVVRMPGSNRLGPPQPVGPEARTDLQFAWLSEAAYGNTDTQVDRRLAAEAAGAPQASEMSAPALGSCPRSQAALFAAGWKPWPNFPNDGLLDKIKRSDLRVEVWTRTSPPAVAVAFGGTILGNRNDWRANLRWFLPTWFLDGHPDMYSETVHRFAPAFVEEFKNKLRSGGEEWAFLKDATIYATGHSLGGGLAQQFAYALPIDAAVPRVTHVYAFDPSPVTGYGTVANDVRTSNQKSLFIDRIYERGEILAIVRSLTSFIVTPSESAPTIRGVRFSLFYPANPIAGHSMSQLACKLYDAARDEAPPAVASSASR